jgi:Ca-activated chloride channel homolog
MKRYHLLSVVGCWALALGCGSTSVRETGDAPGDGRYRIAQGGDPSQSAPSGSLDDAPPYVFTPRSHAPLYRDTDRVQVDLATLPRLQMRLDKCFGREEEKSPVPIATSPRPRNGGKKKRGAAVGGSSRSRKAPKSAPKKGRASSAGSGAGELGAVLGAREESASKAPAAPPPPHPEPPRQSGRPLPGSNSGASAPDYAAAPEEAAAESMEKEEAPSPRRAEDEKKRIASDRDAPAAIADEAPATEAAADLYDEYDDWGAAIYLSNDDTMSLSSAQRVIFAIDNFLPLPLAHIRPHELLNYFSFDTAEVKDGYDFSVEGEVAPDSRERDIYTLGLAVRGRPVDRASRRNAAITFVIDRSGSMSDEGRMTYLKQGMLRMVDELKTGDVVHLVLFDHDVCVPAENFVVGRDNIGMLKKAINALEPRGSTDLQRGLSKGYEIADRSYQQGFSNRVVMITDALTNTGVTDEQMISMISKYYDARQIRLSGVGVGRDFNDSLLDKLTERGKGAYVFLGSAEEVDAVFGARFISLIETTALDVRFRLHLPPSLRMNVFYGEESSTVKKDVQEIHYFANTSHLFLSDLMAQGGMLRPQDWVMLTIEYRDPESGEPLQEEYAFSLESLAQRDRNVEKARVIMTWIDMLAAMAARPVPPGVYHRSSAGAWQDPDGWQRCEDGEKELEKLARNVADDPEIGRVKVLWNKYCARYERPRHPVRRKIAVPDDSWPGASPPRR